MKNKPIPKWKLERQQEIRERLIIGLVMLDCLLFGFATGSCGWYDFTPKYEEISTESMIIPEHDFELYGGFLADDVEIEEIEVSAEEVESVFVAEEEEVLEPKYSVEEMMLLARVIYAEGGTTSDQCCLYIGSVAMNRVASQLYEDNLHDVIYSTRWGVQYACAYNGALNKEPDDRAKEIATEVLDHYYEYGETFLPSNVLGQAGFVTLHGEYCRVDGVIFSYY